MELILKYFVDLSEDQKALFGMLYDIYEDWNSKINVISRKDFEFFYLKHVLHSLAIAKYTAFKPGQTVIDIGSGGGFPGIPLAILFPEVHFTLLDSIKKKMTVASEVVSHLGLSNVKTVVERSENVKATYDHIVSRAVTQLPKFMTQSKHLIDWKADGSSIWYLKGGDFQDELEALRFKYNVQPISDFFEEDFFETKKIVRIYR